jgi:hypothetical protein
MMMGAETAGHRRRLGGHKAARRTGGPRGGGCGTGGWPERAVDDEALTAKKEAWRSAR